jgi:hypothetical protein
MNKTVAQWVEVWVALIGRPAIGELPALPGVLNGNLPGIPSLRLSRLRRALETTWLPKIQAFEKERKEIWDKAGLTDEQRQTEVSALQPMLDEVVEVPFALIPEKESFPMEPFQREALLDFFE